MFYFFILIFGSVLIFIQTRERVFLQIREQSRLFLRGDCYICLFFFFVEGCGFGVQGFCFAYFSEFIQSLVWGRFLVGRLEVIVQESRAGRQLGCVGEREVIRGGIFIFREQVVLRFSRWRWLRFDFVVRFRSQEGSLERCQVVVALVVGELVGAKVERAQDLLFFVKFDRCSFYSDRSFGFQVAVALVYDVIFQCWQVVRGRRGYLFLYRDFQI